MVRLFVKYLIAIGVVFFGFQLSAFADEEKEKKTDKTTSTASKTSKLSRDTIVITLDGDITVGDTLVFDDFDEEEEEGGESGSISLNIPKRITATPYQPANESPSESSETVVDSNERGENVTSSTLRSSDATENKTVAELKILKMSVYPNPASQGFEPVNIQHNLDSEVVVSIISINGQLAKTITTSDKVIPVSGLQSGLYIITITGQNQLLSRKLLVQ